MTSFLSGLAWLIGAAWGLSGVLIASSAGRLYLWRIAIPLGPFTWLLLPREERPEWFAPSQGNQCNAGTPKATTPVETECPRPREGVAKELVPASMDPEFAAFPQPGSPSAARNQKSAAVPAECTLAVCGLIIFLLVFAGVTQIPSADNQGVLEASHDHGQAVLPAAGQPATREAPNAGAAASVVPAQRDVRPLETELSNLPRRLPRRRFLGIDEEPVSFPDGRRGMMINRIYRGTPAHGGGLRVGEVLWSVNGYLTQEYGHLAWIIANQAPGDSLRIAVYSPLDDVDRLVVVYLPEETGRY